MAIPAACGADDEEASAAVAEAKRKAERAASTAFVPDDPAPQPPLPPGAGPYNGPPPTPDAPDPPLDAGGTRDSGSTRDASDQ